MGVDLHGKRPNNPGANYGDSKLSFNWWAWRALAGYCWVVAPELCERSHHVTRWQTNDGRMTADEADQLAFILQREIDAGRAKTYVQHYYRTLEEMPDVKCTLCNGTGKRPPSPLRSFFTHQGRMTESTLTECNGCDGYGSHRPTQCSYSLSVERIQQLATFAKHSGGFEVN